MTYWFKEISSKVDFLEISLCSSGDTRTLKVPLKDLSGSTPKNELGEVIVDPDTNEELEQLHIVKGSARIETIQERIATLRTSEERVLRAAVKRRKNASDIRSIFAGLNEYEIVEPAVTEPKKFLNLKVGDLIIPKNN